MSMQDLMGSLKRKSESDTLLFPPSENELRATKSESALFVGNGISNWKKLRYLISVFLIYSTK